MLSGNLSESMVAVPVHLQAEPDQASHMTESPARRGPRAPGTVTVTPIPGPGRPNRETGSPCFPIPGQSGIGNREIPPEAGKRGIRFPIG